MQPVKVVTSMGQQSVGKSFSLNHLLDTSFAGSAMRTTGTIITSNMYFTGSNLVYRGRVDVGNAY
jgi:hypothetical protein